jgi:alpha-L-fucosidase 2
MKRNSNDNLSLDLAAPITRWDEALPLGNGEMGCLVWGEDNVVRLSLDRGDLWDERLNPGLQHPEFNWAAMKRFVARKDMKTFGKRFDDPFNEPTPTKIPGGRVELTMPAAIQLRRFHLDFKKATAQLFAGATRPIAEMFLPREVPVVAIRWGKVKVKPAFVMPAFGNTLEHADANGVGGGAVGKLGYPAPEYGQTKGIKWCRQRSAPGQGYALAIGEKDGEMMVSLVFGALDEVLATACAQVERALATGYAALLRKHQSYWCRFWNESVVTLPDPAIAQHYQTVNYFLGSLSRRGAPPMPLQGVWTADEGTLPPWKGDYHQDLNSEMSYCSYLPAGHLEEGRVFLDYLSGLMPKWREFARDFYGVKEGICVPGVMSLAGQALGGWGMYSLSPTNTAWLTNLFARHWRYTRDEAFLREQAWPFVRETAEFLSALLVAGKDGKLRLPLSSSPEIHNNAYEALVTPNSNYDLALLHTLFLDTAELATAAGEATSRWVKLRRQLEPLAEDAETGLRIAPDEPLRESHRHLAHVMAIYPLGLLTAEKDLPLIERSLRHLDLLGTGLWVGYSFPWASLLAARAGNGGRAATFLRHYLAFTSRNGFHLNGDFRDQGQSWFKYRPFTLEGNFMAAEAVHEMLLQSHGGLIRVFPAVPAEWSEVSFRGLRAEGGFRISALRKNRETINVSVTAQVRGELRLKDPFGGHPSKVVGAKMVKQRGVFVAQLAAGQTLELRAAHMAS